MFIAHLPAGYLLSRAFPKLPAVWLMAGSIIPDVDLFVVYGLGVAAHHHDFITHRPASWGMLFLLGILLRAQPLKALGVGAILHVTLDSVAGRVNWGWPLAEWTMTLVHVPARHDWWALNFLTHPSFLIEIAVVSTAGVLLWRASIQPKDEKAPRSSTGGA